MVIALESSLSLFIHTKKTSQSMLVSVLFKEECQLQSIYKSSSLLITHSSLLITHSSLLTPPQCLLTPPHSSSLTPHHSSSLNPHSSSLLTPPHSSSLLITHSSSLTPHSLSLTPHHSLLLINILAFVCNMLFDQWPSWRMVIAASIVRKSSTGMII